MATKASPRQRGPVAGATSRKRPKAGEVQRLSILVSSSVYGSEDLLDGIYALLDGFGYRVEMSHKGTIPIDADRSAMANCLDAVDRCDLFLGLILPWYGSGKEAPDQLSITHREALRAIELDKPRWFLVHEAVAIARQLLDPLRDEAQKPRFVLKNGLAYKRTPVLSDLRVLELYEAAMRHDVDEIAARRGNWVQSYGTDDEARLFVSAQFRRHRELFEKHLPKLRDTAVIAEHLAKRRRR